MLDRIFRKTWLSPLVGISFVAVGVTGTLMLLHLAPGALRTVHEWIGLLFVVAATIHLALNWRALVSYLRAPSALAALGVGLVLCGALALAGADHDEEKGAGKGGGGHHRRGAPAAAVEDDD